MNRHSTIDPYLCVDCQLDPNVTCPRDRDAKCLICGLELCGAHIGPHLTRAHCVALTLTYCSVPALKPASFTQ